MNRRCGPRPGLMPYFARMIFTLPVLLCATTRAQDTAKPTLTLTEDNGYHWMAYLNPQVNPQANFSGPLADESMFTPWQVTATNGDWTKDLLDARGIANSMMHGWLRLHLKLPNDWAVKYRGILRIYDFNFDAVDETYFNATALGKTGFFPGDDSGFSPKPEAIRSYMVPAELVNWSGDNIIAIHGFHDGGPGGFTISPPKLEATLEGPPGSLLGDLNSDGKINISDATLSLQIATGNHEGLVTNDVNHDETQNVGDTTLILQYAVGLISKFPSGARTTNVEIRSGFHPASISVSVGSTVTWFNRDQDLHTATSGVPGVPDGTFRSPTLAQDVGFSFTFTTPGVYPYFDETNPNNHGTVFVE